ncbi:MAG: hypothetical protein HRU34_17535 [Richelia sp.]|nr:hypothetical protein [Richelia sp.]
MKLLPSLVPMFYVEAIFRRLQPSQSHRNEQVSGAFEYSTHRHKFAEESGKTRLTDEISFSILGGEVVEFMSGCLIQAQLESMFCFRQQVTKRECEE